MDDPTTLPQETRPLVWPDGVPRVAAPGETPQGQLLTGGNVAGRFIRLTPAHDGITPGASIAPLAARVFQLAEALFERPVGPLEAAPEARG